MPHLLMIHHSEELRNRMSQVRTEITFYDILFYHGHLGHKRAKFGFQ